MDKEVLQEEFTYQLKAVNKPNSASKLYLDWSIFIFIFIIKYPFFILLRFRLVGCYSKKSLKKIKLGFFL